MSHASLEHTMIRIRGAAPDSPIAVFKTTVPDSLNAMFADTVKTKLMIEEGHPDLIGVFDGLMDMVMVEKLLSKYVLPIARKIA